MASSEMEKSVKEKEPKQPSSSAPPPSQEPSSAVSADIATSHSSGSQASSPQPHPYMWGVQHMMLPYGTPPPHPYVTMYPPGGMYAHPSMPPGSYPYTPYAMHSPNGVTEASGNTIGGTEGDSKRSDVKEKFRIRRLKRRLKMMRGKRPPVSRNVPIMPKTAAGPPTNLNIGMGYWSAPTSAPIPGVFAPVSRDGGRSQPWLQNLSDRDGGSPIGSLLVDPGCVKRPDLMNWHDTLRG
ncbi:hypothetical protein HA466_0050990 [Hirschfeldia incana]|nr:hypothetical protein HA466_0050990 [Hirschfeldia incana]